MAKTAHIGHRSSGTGTKKEVAAAAAALVGAAAAVGGKLVLDKRANSKHESERAFRLYKDEPTPDGIRRIARGQLDQAHDELADRPKRNPATALHDTRKGFKRLRATVRLARGALDDETYRRENIAFRDAGRCLSGVRDASVLLETLDALETASGNDLPREATIRLRAQLKDEREQALESLNPETRRSRLCSPASTAPAHAPLPGPSMWTASRRSSPACGASTDAAATRCGARRKSPPAQTSTTGVSA